MKILGTIMLLIIMISAMSLVTLKLGSILSRRIARNYRNDVENTLVIAWILSTVLSAIIATISILNSGILK